MHFLHHFGPRHKYYATMFVVCVFLFLHLVNISFTNSVPKKDTKDGAETVRFQTKNESKDSTITGRYQEPGVDDSITTHAQINTPFPYSNACKHNSHPSTRNYSITFKASGRLGNIMFEYAALLGLANVNHRTPFVPSTSILTSIFHISHVKDIPHLQTWTPVIHESHFGKHDTKLDCLPPRNVMLNGFFQSYKYFNNVKTTLMSEFRFLSQIERKAANMFSSILGEIGQNRTVVGVHVRRGDMSTRASSGHGYQVAPVNYFQKAFHWARKKYNDVVFVVVSEDIKWSKDHLKHDDVRFAPKGGREVHLHVLTKCDHVIMSVGTFGWWAGYLADGDVIYYNQSLIPGSVLGKGFDAKDHFPPNWIGIGS